MLAYHGDPANKAAILAQLQAHHDADEIVQGQYWQGGKGCAVGCTLHNPSGGHAEYEPQFGIPQMLARLEDRIFEGLSPAAAKEWPLRFMAAIRPGADLSRVGWQFLHWLLTDAAVNPGINHDLVRAAVKQCADVIAPLAKGEPLDAAESAARSAAWSAESAARSAVWSAESAAESASAVAAWSAAWSAESAAWSAVWSAESAAWSAESAARSAAWSAESAAESAAWSAARSAAWSAERSAAFASMAAKLLSLLEAAP